jgi:hypothetical protein
MTRIILSTLVVVLTFIIGFTGVWLLSRRDRPESKGAPVSEPVDLLATPAPVPKSRRFTPSLRGCGMGYGQVYEMPDGQAMSEGSACSENSRIAKREWRKLIAKATKIVERVPRYKNRFGKWGERVVAFFPPDEHSEETARILWYDEGKCYLYISAPTLEIALEFEKCNAYAY